MVLCWAEKAAIVFCLISSFVSPDPPPNAGSGFEHAIDSFTKLDKLGVFGTGLFAIKSNPDGFASQTLEQADETPSMFFF